MKGRQTSKNEIQLEQNKSNDSSKTNDSNSDTDNRWKITMKQLLKTGCLINGDGPDSA